MTQIIAALLIEDDSIYPREKIDNSHVSSLAHTLESGVVLPPLIVEETSRRIIDGFHRKRAWQRIFGENVEVPVELRTYASEAELFADAVRLNAGHGRKLDRQDQVRCALRLQALGVGEQQIAVALQTTEVSVKNMLVKVVIVKHDPATDGELRPAKPVAYPRAGEGPRELNTQQYQVMRSSSGYRTAQTVTQLTRELESSLVDLDTPGLREKLRNLAEVITGLVQ